MGIQRHELSGSYPESSPFLLIPLIILSGVSKGITLPLVPYRLGAILILPD